MANDTSDTPAKITRLHVVEPVEAHIAGSAKRYRNHGESKLSIAHHKNQLQGGIIRDEKGNAKYTSAERYSAGNEYRRLWEACQSSGRDSTIMDRVNGSGTDGLTIVQAEAIRKLAALSGLLSPVDRLIIQLCAGEDYWPSEAVSKACGASYAKFTIPRLNEALDALVEALIKLRRRSGG